MKKSEVRKLIPPEDARNRFIDNDKKRVSRNPIKRFFKIFFGEGF